MSDHRIIKLILILALLIVPVAGYTDGAYNLKVQSLSPGWTYRSAILNSTLYQQEGFALRVYDLSNETISPHPVNQISFLDGNGGTTGIQAKNGRLYLTGGGQLRIYDIATDRLNPVFLSNLTLTAGDIYVKDNFAYIGGSSITTVDISDSSHPLVLGTTKAAPGSNVVAGDGYVYGSSSNTFSIYDVTNPYHPSIVSNTKAIGTAGIYDIEYYNNTVYIAEFKTNLQAWDVTNRSSPSLLWYCNNASPSYTISAVGLQVVDHYLYVSHRYGSNSIVGGNGGLTIWDISNHIPVIVGHEGSTNLGYTEKISTDGIYATIHQGKIGATVYNVSNVRAPVRKVHLPVPGEIRQFRVSQIGTMTVLAGSGYDGGDWYYNVTDPTTLGDLSQPIAGWNIKPTARQPFGTPIFGNYSYAHGGSNGNYAYIINLTDIENPDFPTDLIGIRYQNDNQIESEYATENRLYTNHRYAVPTSAGTGYQRVWDTTDKEHLVLINESTPGSPWGMMYNYNNSKTNKSQIIQIVNGKSGTTIYLYDPDPISGNLTKIASPKFTYGYTPNDQAYTYDDVSKHAFVFTGDHFIYAINCSDPDNIYLEPAKAAVYITGQSMASNGTDVFIGGLDAGQGSIIMVSFADMLHPKIIDRITNYGGWSPALYYYNGILYAGGGGSVEAIKVIPGSSVLPQQTPDRMNMTPVATATTIKTTIAKTTTAKVPTPWPDDTPTPASSLSVLAIIGAISCGILVLRKQK